MLEVHFLGVSAGDCTIVRSRGRVTMIDINLDAAPEQPNALDYLDAHFPGQALHRYVQAHIELDHMRGLSRLAARRHIKYVWIPVDLDRYMHHPGAEDVEDWTVYDRFRRHLVPETQTVFPTAEQKSLSLDRFDLEGWSIVMPDPTTVGYSAFGEFAPPSYIMALDYAGVRLMLGGEVRRPLWQRFVKTQGRTPSCTVLRASHPVRTPEIGYDAQPYPPALDLLRPAQVVLSADPSCRTAAEQAYRNCGAEVIWLDQGSAVVLRVESDGTHRLDTVPMR